MPYWLDGNNLIGQSAAAASADSHMRQAFLSALSAYYKSGGGRFLVYFDGDDPSRSTPPPGIGVRYSAPLSTDETIIRRLHEIHHPEEVIVVSNDRALTTRCRNAGASVLNWQEFTSKMKTRSVKRDPRIDPQQPVDVEDWIHFFGLDKTKI
jgi:predicted RNA-binding protein with PIN domain